MLLERPISKGPVWFETQEPREPHALMAHLSLARNLADFPFAPRCTPEERRQIGQRILPVFEQMNLLSRGTWYPLDELSSQDRYVLMERRLLVPAMDQDTEGRGVYVGHDQGLAIMVNGEDHLRVRLLTAETDPATAWERLSALDDQFTAHLDFAYDQQLGFLTQDLDHTGTGLKAGMLLHLPCLRDAGKLEESAANIGKQKFLLMGVKTGAGDSAFAAGQPQRVPQRVRIEREALAESLCADMRGAVAGHAREAMGNLYLLVNARSTGMAEAEILFHLRALTVDLMEAERNACTTLMEAAPASVEDRIGRARGIAAGAHLLSFTESLDLLSALRLGAAAGRTGPGELKTLNSLLIRMQRNHLKASLGQADITPLMLDAERARLFRGRFGPGTQN